MIIQKDIKLTEENQDDYLLRAIKLIPQYRAIGFTDYQIARIFGITDDAIRNWIRGRKRA